MGALIAGTETVSRPDATLQVQIIHLTPEGRRGLTVGGGVRSDGSIQLAIPSADRPFCEQGVLDYYDGPLLMVLDSPLWGKFLAMALGDEEGPWPFLITAITDEQLAAVKLGLDLTYSDRAHTPESRSTRQQFVEAEKVFLLRDYGAQDLVAEPVAQPIKEDWLPDEGY